MLEAWSANAGLEVTQRLDTIVVPGHAGSLTPPSPPGPGHSIGTMVSPGFSCLRDAIKLVRIIVVSYHIKYVVYNIVA